MKKILIVDDETLIRGMIRECVNYEELGYRVVGEAGDGKEALERIEELNPDLIILDINLPVLNGIELSKVVKGKYPEISIIILTGYGEFEYAKECLKIGVADYLLKPIKEEELIYTLQKVSKEIEMIMLQKQYLSKLESESVRSGAILLEQYLNTLLTNKNSIEAVIEEQFRHFRLKINPENLMLITIEIDNFFKRWDKEENRRLWKFAVFNIASEILVNLGPGQLFYGPGAQIIYLTQLEPGVGREEISFSCKKLTEVVKGLLRFSISLGISLPFNGYSNISNAYFDTTQCLYAKFYLGFDQVIFTETLKVISPPSVPFVLSIKENIMMLLRTGNKEEYIAVIRNLQNKLCELRPSTDAARLAFLELTSYSLKYMLENNVKNEEITRGVDHYSESIKCMETMEEIVQWLIQLVDYAMHQTNSQSSTKSLEFIGKVKKYIDLNFSKPKLSLEEIANRVFINPSYLSKVFKRETKINIVEYITEVRMNKAKEYMDENPKSSIGFIASAVGYEDPFYFSKLFKKSFGIAPSKYLEMKH